VHVYIVQTTFTAGPSQEFSFDQDFFFSRCCLSVATDIWKIHHRKIETLSLVKVCKMGVGEGMLSKISISTMLVTTFYYLGLNNSFLVLECFNIFSINTIMN
jgi:hypothetical protein